MRFLRATLLAVGLMSFMACGGGDKKVENPDKTDVCAKGDACGDGDACADGDACGGGDACADG